MKWLKRLSRKRRLYVESAWLDGDAVVLVHRDGKIERCVFKYGTAELIHHRWLTALPARAELISQSGKVPERDVPSPPSRG